MALAGPTTLGGTGGAGRDAEGPGSDLVALSESQLMDGRDVIN